jgi:hypothetical protein
MCFLSTVLLYISLSFLRGNFIVYIYYTHLCQDTATVRIYIRMYQDTLFKLFRFPGCYMPGVANETRFGSRTLGCNSRQGACIVDEVKS